MTTATKEDIAKYFKEKPLSPYAIHQAKAFALNEVVLVGSDPGEVFDFLLNADLSSDDFDSEFENTFGEELTPLECYEDCSVGELRGMINDLFTSFIEKLHYIILEREA